MSRILLGAWAPGLLVLSLPLYATSAELHQGKPRSEFHISYFLEEGWNLRNFPFAASEALEFFAAHSGAQIWEAELPAEPFGPDTPRSLLSPGEVHLASVTANKVYWVFSKTAASFHAKVQVHDVSHPFLEAGWNAFGVSKDHVYRDPKLDRILSWNPRTEDYHDVPLGRVLRVGIGYFAYARESGILGASIAQPDADFVRRSTPKAPSRFVATGTGKQVSLSWDAPKQWIDGSAIPPGVDIGYEVVRSQTHSDGTIGERVTRVFVEQPRFTESVSEFGLYQYTVRAAVKGEDGTDFLSPPSDIVEQAVLRPLAITALGSFEAPSAVSLGDERVALPSTAIVQGTKNKHIYLAHVVRGENGSPDALRLLLSRSSGQPGSFRQLARVRLASPLRTITELCVAARAKRVLVGVIRREPGQAQFGIEVFEQNQSGPAPVLSLLWADTPSTHARRDLSLALDRWGDAHMVWSEKNKVFYAKNFKVEMDDNPTPHHERDPRLSVFDIHRRRPADETVRYLAQYSPNDRECEWCEEHYRIERDGDYVEWWEEAYVYAPSLHVDDHTVTVVGRQFRVWDNKPVLNEAWTAMMEDPVWSHVLVQRKRPTRFPVGWHSVWKKAYEPGDELLWPGLGYQHQYLYQGTEHQTDQIRVAQRPLAVDALAQEDEQLRTKGTGAAVLQGSPSHRDQDGVRAHWRTAVVDTIEDVFSERPSYPRLAASNEGRWALVYEKGTDNRLHLSTSQDGGQNWSRPKLIQTEEGLPVVGYMPGIAFGPEGELLVVYAAYKSEPESGVWALYLARSSGDNEYWSTAELSKAPIPPIFRPNLRLDEPDRNTSYSDAYDYIPQIQVRGSLAVVPFVGAPPAPERGDRLWLTRASWDNKKRQISSTFRTAHPGASKTISADLRLVNADYVAVYDDRVTLDFPRNGVSGASGPVALSFVSGQASFSSTHNVEMLAVDPTFVLAAAATQKSDSTPWASGPQPAPFYWQSGNVDGNVLRAQLERTRLEQNQILAFDSPQAARDGTAHFYGERFPPQNQEVTYLSEYRLNEGHQKHQEDMRRLLEDPLWTSKESEDAKHLAGFKRVWAYTLGIALAQASRDRKNAAISRAQSMARYLCAYAVLDPRRETELQGWHFSWNTQGDNWRDARLVTGATAWAIHGLGIFISSEAFRTLETDKAWIKTCYERSLRGLLRHRRRIRSQAGQEFYLMTAGTTTQGLRFAGRLHAAGLSKDPQLRLGYYTVLDAIGYDAYDDENPAHVRACRRGDRCDTIPVEDTAVWADEPLPEDMWRALRKPTEALNVVTEHNLDVLSVLNHALDHADTLGLTHDRELGPEPLRAWRNQLREGIFQALWDNEGWKDEFIAAIAEDPQSPEAGRLQGFLDSGAPLGRFITGGGDVTPLEEGQDDPDPLYRWENKSSHAAIDNCSWLSLSVDYEDLEEQTPAHAYSSYVEQLDQCLQYTVARFVKPLGFGTGRNYIGSHYFQNAFRDPYIAPSERQASSYHLEATMGLILGLYRFSEAHPNHPHAAEYRGTALTLWAHAQAFVSDHGFPYSSQRIHNLSTLLSSGTAVVWFLDVHQQLTASSLSDDRPLRHYAANVPLLRVTAFIQKAYSELIDTLGQGVLVQSEIYEGRPRTRVEDQALTLQVALSQGDFEVAGRLVDGLLHWSASDEPLRRIVDQETGLPVSEGVAPLGAQMLVISSMADFARQAAHTPQAGAAKRFVFSRLLSLEAAAFRHDPDHISLTKDARTEAPHQENAGATPITAGHDRGLFRAIESPETHASIADNTLAYFALRRAQALYEDPFTNWANAVARALTRACFDVSSGIPMEMVFPSASPRAAESVETFSLCALFYQSRGDLQKAQHLLNALDDLTGQNQAFLKKSSFDYLPPALDLLARRTVSSIDPRQEALALVGLSQLTEEPSFTARHALGLLLVQEPGGWLSVELPELVSVDTTVLHETDAKWMSVRKTISDRYAHTLFSLLASDYESHRFDALIRSLVRLRFALSMADQDTPTPLGAWVLTFGEREYVERLTQTVAELRTFCQHEGLLLNAASLSLDSLLGLDNACAVLERAFVRMLEVRRGPEDGTYYALMSLNLQEEHILMNDLARSLSEKLERDLSQNTFAFHLGAPGSLAHETPDLSFATGQRANLSPDASLTEVRQAVRHYLKERLDNWWDNVRGQRIFFELHEVDAMEAFHYSSPSFWMPASVALRQSLAPGAPSGLHFLARAQEAPRPIFPRPKPEEDRSRAFRQLVHRFADGHLPLLAHTEKLQTGWLHRRLRTGMLVTTDFQRLVEGSPESDQEASNSPGPEEVTAWFERPQPGMAETTRHITGEELSTVSVLRLKQVFRNPGRSFFGAFRELVHSEPALAALAVPWVLPLASISERDAGLTTMIAFNQEPSQAWVEVGTIAADAIIKEVEFGEYHSGVALFFEDETQIRAHQTYQTPGGSSRIFSREKIYGFDTSHIPDLIPIDPKSAEDSLLGAFAPDSPELIGQNGRVKVLVLDTAKSKDEVIDEFLRHHIWWQNILEIAVHLPDDAVREGLLQAARGLLLGGFFDADAAERSAGTFGVSPNGGSHPAWYQNARGYANWEERRRSKALAANNVDDDSDDSEEGTVGPEPPSWLKEIGEVLEKAARATFEGDAIPDAPDETSTIDFEQLFQDNPAHVDAFDRLIDKFKALGSPTDIRFKMFRLAPKAPHYLGRVLFIKAEIDFGSSKQFVHFLAFSPDGTSPFDRFALAGHWDPDENVRTYGPSNAGLENFYLELDEQDGFQKELGDLLRRSVNASPTKITQALIGDQRFFRPTPKDFTSFFGHSPTIKLFGPAKVWDLHGNGRAALEHEILDNYFFYHLVASAQSVDSLRFPVRTYMIGDAVPEGFFLPPSGHIFRNAFPSLSPDSPELNSFLTGLIAFYEVQHGFTFGLYHSSPKVIEGQLALLDSDPAFDFPKEPLKNHYGDLWNMPVLRFSESTSILLQAWMSLFHGEGITEKTPEDARIFTGDVAYMLPDAFFVARDVAPRLTPSLVFLMVKSYHLPWFVGDVLRKHGYQSDSNEWGTVQKERAVYRDLFLRKEKEEERRYGDQRRGFIHR